MADKSRARGRTRARAMSQAEAAKRPGPEVAAAAGPAAPRQRSRGRVARGTSREEASPVRPVGAEASAGLSARMSAVTLGEGSGDGGTRGGGRGAWRGRNEEQAIVKSRPAHITNKQGEYGNPTNLIANYFEVTSRPNWAMYHYHVDFNPEVEGVRTRRALLHEHDEAVLGRNYLFDGMALFMSRRLERDEMDLLSTRKSDDEKIRVHLKLTRELPPRDPVVMQICNIQMRKNMEHMKFSLLGRHFYDMHESSSVSNHNLEVWPGYVTAIHQHENSILMCAELAFKVLRLDTVHDQLLQLLYRFPTSYKDESAKALVGSIVLTRYNNKTYRIDDIDWDMTPSSEFDVKGTRITYIDYYKKNWNVSLNDLHQPLLVSLAKKKDKDRGSTDARLVPELCYMTGISEATRMDFKVMKDMAIHTRKDPVDRARILTNFIQRVQNNPDVKRDMGGWGLAFANELVKIKGRNLPGEKILFCNAKLQYKPQTADWSSEMRSSHLYHALPLNNWVLICTERDQRLAQDFHKALSRVGPPMGVAVGQPIFVPLRGDRLNDYTSALQANVRPGVQLVLCVVPNDRKDRYDAIKKSCCIDNPVPSQVVVARTLSKQQMLMSVCTKIAIQLNCKLGGSAWALELPMKNVMVIGYDSYHDSSQRGRSVGGFCCSMDPLLTRYYSRVTFQTTHQEMLSGFQTNLAAALRRYHQLNGTLPDKVFVYRDGVGEGQLLQVLEFELRQIMESFKAIGSGEPKLAFVIVTKRINTRIMEHRGNNLNNPLPGTVVDSVITRPEWFDFFLVSQSVRQGTVTPTHYNVIFDTSGLRPDHIQRLTYKLTHLYYNWPGTIRVPAPCMYAHKLAFLTGQSLHTVPNEELADTLFFL